MALSTNPERGGRIVLVRHGETEWSRSGRHTGLTDIPLTPTGEYKAQLAGRLIAGRKFARVLTSPLQRARETARYAGFPTAETDIRLVEWDYGAYEGLTTPQIVEQLGTPWTVWEQGAPAGLTPGETVAEVTSRAESLIASIEPLLREGTDILLFSHGHFLRALTGVWLGLTATAGQLFSLDTSAVCELGYERDYRVISEWNRVPGQ
ncbi:MAG: histidine phosphatase family protein [Lacisediminihabitans sp.]